MAHEAIIQNSSPCQIFTPNEFDSYPSLIKSTSTTKYIPVPMTTLLINYSLASFSRQIHAHADIYTRRRKQSVAHKSGRQFFETDVRGIGTSLQDDAEDGYNLDWRAIFNFGRVLQIELCARQYFACESAVDTIKTSRRWKVLWSGSWCCGPAPCGVLRYSLSSLGTYSTWEGDISDHISRGEKLKDDGGMSG